MSVANNENEVVVFGSPHEVPDLAKHEAGGMEGSLNRLMSRFL
jgi:hypothetical protein